MTRPRRRTGADRLTEEQLDELCSPMRLLLPGVTSAFESDEARERAWRRHRERVVTHYREHYPCGNDPWPAAWHAYDGPEEERSPYWMGAMRARGD